MLGIKQPSVSADTGICIIARIGAETGVGADTGASVGVDNVACNGAHTCMSWCRQTLRYSRQFLRP